MESSKNNIDSFERFLRDKTDEFRMYPSKRVWYSIYNNMHPGTRLPSLSMSIILICSLFLIGYLNTDVNKQYSANTVATGENQKSSSAVIATVQEPSEQIDNIDFNTTAPLTINTNKTSQSDKAYSTKTDTKVTSRAFTRKTNQLKTVLAINTSNAIIDFTHKESIVEQSNNEITGTITIDPASITEENIATDILNTETYNPIVGIGSSKENNASLNTENKETIATTVSQNELNTNGTISIVKAPDSSIETAKPAEDKAAKENNIDGNKITNDIAKHEAISDKLDKAWMDDFVLYNKPVAKKWAGKLSWTAYITPSVVYRHLRNNAPDKLTTDNSNYNSANVDVLVKHKASFGAEAGFGLLYDVKKKIKLKAGVQFNYSRYNAHAYENHHPIGTSILLNNDNNSGVYESFRSSPYSNTVGLTAVKLHNESYQLSLPIGADIRLASLNDKINWYAGATIQPTFILYGKSYIVSSDRRSYVTDKSLLNKFNLNAGFETYLSFKTNNYTWQVGPQFRSQIFSTNTRLYTVEERLLNFGFKVGINKRF